jgi:hypothetical protein
MGCQALSISVRLLWPMLSAFFSKIRKRPNINVNVGPCIDVGELSLKPPEQLLHVMG